jgi:hypothetical protein
MALLPSKKRQLPPLSIDFSLVFPEFLRWLCERCRGLSEKWWEEDGFWRLLSRWPISQQRGRPG